MGSVSSGTIFFPGSATGVSVVPNQLHPDAVRRTAQAQPRRQKHLIPAGKNDSAFTASALSFFGGDEEEITLGIQCCHPLHGRNKAKTGNDAVVIQSGIGAIGIDPVAFCAGCGIQHADHLLLTAAPSADIFVFKRFILHWSKAN